MPEKTYKIKPQTVRAIQFDGTDECAMFLKREYQCLEWDGIFLSFTGNYEEEFVLTGDWLIVEGFRVVQVIDRDVFDDMYELCH